MSEKLAEVYAQYEMDIVSTRKGRGATILTTTDGPFILEPFRGSVTRLEQEYVLKNLFRKEGMENLDYIIPNKEGMLFTCDKYRQPYVLKKHFEGDECDMHSERDILCAVQAMAVFHIYGKKVAEEYKEAWEQDRILKEEKKIEEIQRAIADGEELEKIAYVYEISQSALEKALKCETNGENCVEKESTEADCTKTEDWTLEKQAVLEVDGDKEIEDTFIRHNRELKKIYRFVSKVKQKNAFENLFLQVFPAYFEQGEACLSMLSDFRQKRQNAETKRVLRAHYGICHGAYNQHNVILGAEEVAIVHFERFSKGNQLQDLYQFTRKVMEKNHFDHEMLRHIFEAYDRKIPLSGEDYAYMYTLFSYPEKFWKIANGYYNTKKAFLSPKYLEKLETVIRQEEEKRAMLKKYADLFQTVKI